MSFFSGGKTKDRAMPLLNKDQASSHNTSTNKKSQFYVEFLGWMESGGLRGRKYTDPVVQELKRRQMTKKTSASSGPPKLTIQMTHKELKITQEMEMEEGNKGGSSKPRATIKKIKFPAIPARDVTFCVQSRRSASSSATSSSSTFTTTGTTATGLEDIVACIYLGYMPRTRRYVHVHVYRFDAPSTAATFAHLLGELVQRNLPRIGEVERQLAAQGEIEDPRLGSSDGMSSQGTQRTDSASGGSAHSEDGWGYGYPDSLTLEESEEDGYDFDGYPPAFLENVVGGGSGGGDDEDLRSLSEVQPFDSVAEELKHRLTVRDEEGPLLLPPKDYDTISRARGNLLEINERRCLNLTFTGKGGGGGPAADTMLPSDQQRCRNTSEESGIDMTSPTSDGGGDVIISRFPSQTEDLQSPPRIPLQGNGRFVYPPTTTRWQQERGGAYAHPHQHPPHPHKGLAHLGRQSSQPSMVLSSRAGSQHSDGSAASQHSAGERGGGGGARVYRRSHSDNSFSSLPPTAAQVAAARQQADPAVVPFSEDLLPPADYDDEDDEEGPSSSYRGEPGMVAPVVRPHPPFPPPPPSPLHDTAPGGGSLLLMRSLPPASILHHEMGPSPLVHSPRGGVGGRGEEGEFVYAVAQKRSQPVFPASPRPW